MSTTTSRRRARQPLAPVSGSIRVLRPVGAVNEDTGEVLLNGQCYYLHVHETGYRLHGYDHGKQAPTCYDLPLSLDSCDCPDRTFRPEREACKHMAGMRALKAAGKLPEPGAYKPDRNSGIPF